jgi:hypothetical protein
MPPEEPPDPPVAPSRTQRRRERDELFGDPEQVRAQQDAFTREREAFLQSKLEPDEVVLARRRRGSLLTNRRILSARQFHKSPQVSEWLIDSLPFSKITRWALGSQHDGRPIIRLEHEPVLRVAYAPAHRFLSFEWGSVEVLLPQAATTLEFPRTSDRFFVAVRDALERAAVPQSEGFVVRPEGTREERRGVPVPLTRITRFGDARLRRRSPSHRPLAR